MVQEFELSEDVNRINPKRLYNGEWAVHAHTCVCVRACVCVCMCARICACLCEREMHMSCR